MKIPLKQLVDLINDIHQETGYVLRTPLTEVDQETLKLVVGLAEYLKTYYEGVKNGF